MYMGLTFQSLGSVGEDFVFRARGKCLRAPDAGQPGSHQSLAASMAAFSSLVKLTATSPFNPSTDSPLRER